MNSEQGRKADFEKQMAALMPTIEGASQEVLIEALLESCGTIVTILTNKQATGMVLDFGAAQLAHDFVLDNRGAGVKRRALNRIDPTRAAIN